MVLIMFETLLTLQILCFNPKLNYLFQAGEIEQFFHKPNKFKCCVCAVPNTNEIHSPKTFVFLRQLYSYSAIDRILGTKRSEFIIFFIIIY